MIQLTRLRQNTPFILNPDLIERVDTHVDTVVRLTSGTEYVVNESGAEIVRRTIEFRAHVIALAGILEPSITGPDTVPVGDVAPAPDVPGVIDAPGVEPVDEPAIEFDERTASDELEEATS
jgi:flagellar protein FlbD